VALSDEIKDGLSFLSGIQSTAKGNQAELELAAVEIRKIADLFGSLSRGDAKPLDVTLTKWTNVNKLLLAKASAEQELTSGSSPDWNKIGDGVATAVGIAVKIALAIAAV
jgi:hypothetical protein